MKVSDYFAELYVAGRFADAGWNVYFPRRDRGFDFIATRPGSDGIQIIRPVQVKGKFPTSGKTDKVTYGYIGELTQQHPAIVLAIPFFSGANAQLPSCTAYMPFGLVRAHSRGFRCEPAAFQNGAPRPRCEYTKFFDDAGLRLVQEANWAGRSVEGAA